MALVEEVYVSEATIESLVSKGTAGRKKQDIKSVGDAALNTYCMFI